jgi:hypothetical protein
MARLSSIDSSWGYHQQDQLLPTTWCKSRRHVDPWGTQGAIVSRHVWIFEFKFTKINQLRMQCLSSLAVNIGHTWLVASTLTAQTCRTSTSAPILDCITPITRVTLSFCYVVWDGMAVTHTNLNYRYIDNRGFFFVYKSC